MEIHLKSRWKQRSLNSETEPFYVIVSDKISVNLILLDSWDPKWVKCVIKMYDMSFDSSKARRLREYAEGKWRGRMCHEILRSFCFVFPWLIVHMYPCCFLHVYASGFNSIHRHTNKTNVVVTMKSINLPLVLFLYE